MKIAQQFTAGLRRCRRISESRRDDRSEIGERCDPQASQPSLRDSIVARSDTCPSDESLGYFRMSLRDKHTPIGWPVRLRQTKLCFEPGREDRQVGVVSHCLSYH